MLCDICQMIFTGVTREPNSPGGGYPRYSAFITAYRRHCETVASIRKSAESWCIICTRLWRLFLKLYPAFRQDSLDASELFPTSYSFSSETNSVMQVCFDARPSDYLMFKLSPLKMIAPEIQSDNTNSQQTLNIVRKWLRNCLETHKRCNHTAEPAWRPTRLLELDSPFSDYVTLNCTGPEATIVQTESYATLSHCWGHGDPLKLTSSSFPRLVGGIPVTELPKTFQDAIVIVRSLGLKCVWIDSLCIFQDSKDDWTSESSSMGKVYSQAVLNIGATASFGSNEGCIRERNPRFIHKKGIETSWSDRLNGRFQIYLHSKSATLDDISSTSPLLRRGWVVQEHVLCRRFVHFDFQQVIFECREDYASEMYSEGAPKDMALLTHPLVKRDEPSILTSRISDASRAIKVYKFWASLVEFYSRCSLTFKTDKLIALSGIAKIIQNATGETYFAGLWESQFPQCLMWRALRNDDPRQAEDAASIPSAYIAPSWSWASSNCELWVPWMDLYNSPLVPVAEVVQTKVALASSDPTGQVLSGSIKLLGLLWTVVIRLVESLDLEGKLDIQVKTGVVRIMCHKTACAFDKYPFSEISGSIDLHFMPITHQPNGSFQGLLLVPTGNSRGQFRRVGLLYFKWDEWVEDSWDEAIRAENHDWLEYVEFDGVDKYTITII